MNIKVSVILPVYNEELYLQRCLDSICGQTLEEIEIICVDDGSTDHSLNILYDYAKRDERVKVLAQKNCYAGAARNYGMKNAEGKYLLFLDSDDFFELDMLEKLYEKAEDRRLHIVMCRYDSYDNYTNRSVPLNFSNRDCFLPIGKECFSGKELKDAGIFQVTAGWAWDKLFNRKFVQECGYTFSEFRSSEDGFFVYMLMARAERIGILPERMVHHRVNNTNSLSNTKDADWENGFRMLGLIAEELVKQGLYREFEKSFVSFAIEFLEWYLGSMYEKTAFYNCYKCIKEEIEPRFQLLQFPGTFLCEEQSLMRYCRIINMETWEFLFMQLKEQEDTFKKAGQKDWIFPYANLPRGCRLVLYGAGAIGQAYQKQLLYTGYCSKVYVVDKDYERYKEFHVESPKILEYLEFDRVLIAVYDIKMQWEISRWLQSLGINREQILNFMGDRI